MRTWAFVLLLGCHSNSTTPSDASSDASSDARAGGSGQQISLFDGPLNAAGNDYTHFMTILATPANHAYMTGVTSTLPLGCSGTCTGATATYLDHGTTCPNAMFDGIDALLGTVAGYGYINNLILSGVSYVNNSSTPAYLGSQAWADTLEMDCSAPDSSLTWAPSQLYLPGDYIKVGANYWKMTNTCGTGTHDVRCASGAGSMPSCLTTSGPTCPDGDAGWTNTMDGHAPPLDYWCDANTTNPMTQFDCYQLKVTGGSIATGVATVTVTSPPTFPNMMMVTLTDAPTGFNCPNGCMVKATTPTQVQYYVTANDVASTTFAATITGAHSLNIKTPNATTDLLSHQEPIPYEQPMRRWREYLFTKIHEHYAAAGAPAIGYVRLGLTKGGETDTSGIAGWPLGSQDQMLSYENEIYTLMGKNGCGDTFACLANLHTYPTQEAAYANANNIGFDNNAFGVDQVTAIVDGKCATPGALPNGGDWCLNFGQYPTLPNGKPAIMTLQTGGRTQYSSPGSCAAKDVGAMSADATCTTAPFTTGYPGNLPIAYAHGATNIEMYFCDAMLAMDPDYASNHCMFKVTQATYESLYQAAFAAFLTR